VRKLAVGHFLNADFKSACQRHVDRIRETFFAWPGVASCRPSPDFTPELRARMISDLTWARENGIELDTLFNCNCYGDIAISQELVGLVGNTLREMDREGLFPETVTTTSPFIATILRRDFPSVKIRFSVNQRVHGSIGFEYVEELFDSFYASREHHRDLLYLQNLAKWAHAHGKQIGIQANSGCLRQCPFQTFHDNLHGHDRIRQSGVGDDLGFSVFRCKTNYEHGRFEDFLRATWIRPEDIRRYSSHIDFVKIATRRHPDPVAVLDAYATSSYHGNLTEIMDPSFAFPESIDNDSLGRSSLWSEVFNCRDANNCRHCGKCEALLKEVSK